MAFIWALASSPALPDSPHRLSRPGRTGTTGTPPRTHFIPATRFGSGVSSRRWKWSSGLDCSDMSELSRWPTCRPAGKRGHVPRSPKRAAWTPSLRGAPRSLTKRFSGVPIGSPRCGGHCRIESDLGIRRMDVSSIRRDETSLPLRLRCRAWCGGVRFLRRARPSGCS